MSSSPQRLPWIVYPGFLVGVIGLALFLVPPFLLPAPIYDSVYGWRFPQGWECGDALVTDRGPNSAADRISADLGEQQQDGELRLCRVPKETLELMLLVPSESAGPRPRIELVRTARTEGADPIPVLELGTDATWEHAASPVPGWSAVRSAVRFEATPKAEYLLRLEGVAEGGVRLVFVGGGWRR